MILSLIAAMDKNRVIGNKNSLPWRLPKDLEHVKNITQSSTIIMGRKNYESIGRTLPDRRNIILTRNLDYEADKCEVYHSVEDILNAVSSDDEVYIFGGEEIYYLFLPYVKTMYITHIEHEFEGDTFFPVINWGEWNHVYRQAGIKDEKNPYEYYFDIYEKCDNIES